MRTKRRGIFRLRSLLVVVTLLVGLVAVLAGPASASSCVLGSPTNPYTGHVQAVHFYNYTNKIGSAPVASRSGCVVVWVVGPDAGGNFNFAVAYQDTNDQGAAQYDDDDAGTFMVRYRTPGSASNDWHYLGQDVNSADFTPNQDCGGHGHIDPCWLGTGVGAGPGAGGGWVSLNTITNGAPSGWSWEIVDQSHVRHQSLGAPWTWSDPIESPSWFVNP